MWVQANKKKFCGENFHEISSLSFNLKLLQSFKASNVAAVLPTFVWLGTTQPETNVVAFHALNMAEAAQVEKRQGEASTSSNPVGDIVSPFAELLEEMKQMNANITSMRGDLNNLVVENVSEHGSDINLSELNNEVDSPRHDTETISIDTKVERLLKETSGAQTSEDSSANPDSLLTTIAQELDVSEQMGAAVHSGLAPIVDGLLGSKLSDEK